MGGTSGRQKGTHKVSHGGVRNDCNSHHSGDNKVHEGQVLLGGKENEEDRTQRDVHMAREGKKNPLTQCPKSNR